jgi:hypothetical protein
MDGTVAEEGTLEMKSTLFNITDEGYEVKGERKSKIQDVGEKKWKYKRTVKVRKNECIVNSYGEDGTPGWGGVSRIEDDKAGGRFIRSFYSYSYAKRKETLVDSNVCHYRPLKEVAAQSKP